MENILVSTVYLNYLKVVHNTRGNRFSLWSLQKMFWLEECQNGTFQRKFWENPIVKASR